MAFPGCGSSCCLLVLFFGLGDQSARRVAPQAAVTGCAPCTCQQLSQPRSVSHLLRGGLLQDPVHRCQTTFTFCLGFRSIIFFLLKDFFLFSACLDFQPSFVSSVPVLSQPRCCDAWPPLPLSDARATNVWGSGLPQLMAGSGGMFLHGTRREGSEFSVNDSKDEKRNTTDGLELWLSP